MAKNLELERLVSRQTFAKAARLREKEITVADLGIVRIRELDTAQRIRYMEYLEIDPDSGKPKFNQAKQVEFNKFVISMGLITGDSTKDNEQGDLMYPDGSVPEIRMDVADRISKAILYLSGILPDPEAKKTDTNPTTGEKQTSGTASP